MQQVQSCYESLNPTAHSCSGKYPDPTMHHLEECQVDATPDGIADDQVSHDVPNGRATNMCPDNSKTLASVIKLDVKSYWTDMVCPSEADIVLRAKEIAETEPDVANHSPVMARHSTSTGIDHEHINPTTEGVQALSVIVFDKLMPIRELAGDELLNCWWDTVKCHLALWKSGVHHGDINLSNLMHKRVKANAVGVLNDFDLAAMNDHGLKCRNAGTIPFMAMEILSETRLTAETYAHDAESFIWVLTWISLQYDDGKLRKYYRPLDHWSNMDPLRCELAKRNFLRCAEHLAAGKGHGQNWLVAQECLVALSAYILVDSPLTIPSDAISETYEKVLYQPFCYRAAET